MPPALRCPQTDLRAQLVRHGLGHVYEGGLGEGVHGEGGGGPAAHDVAQVHDAAHAVGAQVRDGGLGWREGY